MNVTTVSPRTGESIRIAYVPRPGLFGLALVNWLLNVLTLTLYRFWAKTNVRRHIWSCVHINEQPLEYTGRGIELFKGALFVFAVLGLPTIVLITFVSLAFGEDHPAVVGVQLLLFLIVALLWGAAVYRARRYQLSRTLWRGIRGTLAGSSISYSLLYFGAMLARGMTLGWLTPLMNLNLQQTMIGDTRFGDMAFKFKGGAGPLYPRYALCWFLMLAAFIAFAIVFAAGAVAFLGEDFFTNLDLYLNGQSEPSDETLTVMGFGFFAILLTIYVFFFLFSPVVWSIYSAREMSLFAAYTSIDQAQFKLDATAGSLMRLTIGNILLWIFTLGIATPFIQQRVIRYLCDRLTVEGTVDIDKIKQSTAPLGSMGEGLADALDVGGL